MEKVPNKLKVNFLTGNEGSKTVKWHSKIRFDGATSYENLTDGFGSDFYIFKKNGMFEKPIYLGYAFL